MAERTGPGSLYELHARLELREPVLVMAPEGWIDAGAAGAAAVAALMASAQTEVVATFDSDELIDSRARRPTSHISNGVYTALDWPSIELHAGDDGHGHDLLVLSGPEPDSRWQAFADAMAELAGTFGVTMVVGLGAFPAPVPHTRPGQLAASATTSELARRIGIVPATVEVPAGVLAAVERRFASLGVPTVGIWARVPHYAASAPYPAASLLLLEGLAGLTGIVADTTSLTEAAEVAKGRLDELVSNSPQHAALVAQLEAQVDAEEGGEGEEGATSGAGGLLGWGELPSGDELAAEVEQFLRGGGEEEGAS
jgi:predicted ATP-grasp superfamily ATP-dependent carboligase